MTSALSSVQTDSFLTLHYRLGGANGDVVNTFASKPATLSMGSGVLAQALEACLLGLPEGAHRTFDLPAGAAFGERSAQMQQWLSAKVLTEMGSAGLGEPQETYQVGDAVRFPTPDGQGEFAGVVLQVRDDGAVLFDFNHPLAGQAVQFEVQVIGIL